MREIFDTSNNECIGQYHITSLASVCLYIRSLENYSYAKINVMYLFYIKRAKGTGI